MAQRVSAVFHIFLWGEKMVGFSRRQAISVGSAAVAATLSGSRYAFAYETGNSGAIFWADFTDSELRDASRVASLLPRSAPTTAVQMYILMLRAASAARGKKGGSIIWLAASGNGHVIVPTPDRADAVRRLGSVGNYLNELGDQWGGILAHSASKVGNQLADAEKKVRDVITSGIPLPDWMGGGNKGDSYGRLEYSNNHDWRERCQILPVDNESVAIRFVTGFLSDQSSDNIVASKPHVQSWERWKMYLLGDDVVAFRSMKTGSPGYFLSAQEGRVKGKNPGEVQTNGEVPKPEMYGERFKLLPAEGGAFFLECTGGSGRVGRQLSAKS